MFCQNCGAEISEKNKVCNYCGATIPHPKKKKNKIIWGIIIFVLLIGIIFACGSCNNTADEDVVEIESSSVEETIIEEDINSEDVSLTWTAEQKYAFASGLTYLEVMAFSKQRLIDQLSSEYGDNYPLEVAEFAVNAIEEQGLVDWDAECEEAAKNYLDFMSFSKQGLIDQLSSEYGEQFTVEQAERAVEKVYK